VCYELCLTQNCKISVTIFLPCYVKVRQNRWAEKEGIRLHWSRYRDGNNKVLTARHSTEVRWRAQTQIPLMHVTSAYRLATAEENVRRSFEESECCRNKRNYTWHVLKQNDVADS